MVVAPSASYSFTVRLEIRNRPGMLGRVTSVIGKAGGDIGAVDLVEMTGQRVIRDITVKARDSQHGHDILDGLKAIAGVRVANISDRTFLMHLGGKIEIKSKVPIRTRDDLSMAYTPGVARVCLAIRDDPQRAFTLTIKQNTVAVVTDGTAVLGLGDIGPEAAMPVMEGKAMLFKELAGVDAFPICLDTKDPDKIVETVKLIAPAFGGINLEDISAPRCFWVEERLRKELDIPVFHDDQHGTSVVVAAALLNALKIVKKDMRRLKVVVCGVGAAGTATIKILLALGRAEHHRRRRARHDPPRAHGGHGLHEDLGRGQHQSRQRQGRDGRRDPRGGRVHRPVRARRAQRRATSRAWRATASSSRWPIPTPEIQPEEAERHVRVMATGRSDYPNQINNVLCFPGFFRGLLDSRARIVNDEMKIAAAHAIASCVAQGRARARVHHPERVQQDGGARRGPRRRPRRPQDGRRPAPAARRLARLVVAAPWPPRRAAGRW